MYLPPYRIQMSRADATYKERYLEAKRIAQSLKVPLTIDPLPLTGLQDAADIGFLGLMVYREGSNQVYQAKLAIAYTVPTRVASKRWWGGDVMSVITKKWQYSSMTAPGDPNLVRYPSRVTEDAWIESLRAADAALNGREPNPLPDGTDSYYSINIKPPKWATKECYTGGIDKFRFYNVDRDYEATTLGLGEKP